jgi:DNA-binding HxlR family transcriptional regulator
MRAKNEVHGSKTGRPIMRLLDLLGRRWALRLCYELGSGPVAFSELEQRCESISPSVLSQRLRELCEGKLVMVDEDGAYTFTNHGRGIGKVLAELDRRAKAWAKTLD